MNDQQEASAMAVPAAISFLIADIVAPIELLVSTIGGIVSHLFTFSINSVVYAIFTIVATFKSFLELPLYSQLIFISILYISTSMLLRLNFKEKEQFIMEEDLIDESAITTRVYPENYVEELRKRELVETNPYDSEADSKRDCHEETQCEEF